MSFHLSMSVWDLSGRINEKNRLNSTTMPALHLLDVTNPRSIDRLTWAIHLVAHFRIMYAALYNVTIHSVVSPHLVDAELVKTLNDDINDVSNKSVEPDLRLFALKLLHSILRNVCSKATYGVMKNNVSTHVSRGRVCVVIF